MIVPNLIDFSFILSGLFFLPILAYPVHPVLCSRCGKEEWVIMGIFQFIWYCKNCQPFLNEKEREEFEAANKLCLTAVKKVLERKTRKK